MEIESLERRILMVRNLGLTDTAAVVQPNIDPERLLNTRTASSPIVAPIRETSLDFLYASSTLSGTKLQSLFQGSTQITSDTSFFEPGQYQKPTVHRDGYIVAERNASDTDLHTMWVARVENNDSFGAEGIYTLPRRHYMISFDIRHPTSEKTWLLDHEWAVVMQMWGPRETGETPRNPPFALFTKSVAGQPTWTIHSRGDSRAITQTGDVEDLFSREIPYLNVGEWNHWDIEYIPDPSGANGMVRAWLNGQLVVAVTDVKTGYQSEVEGQESGPLNPAFGLYAPLAEDVMQVHFNNIAIKSDGVVQRVLSGTVSNTSGQARIHLRNSDTGAEFNTVTSGAGVYSANVAPGIYTLTASDVETGRQTILENIDLTDAGLLLNFGLPTSVDPSTPVTVEPEIPTIDETPDSESLPEPEVDPILDPTIAPILSRSIDQIMVADVNGDGVDDAIQGNADGTWWVTLSGDGRLTSYIWGSYNTDTSWRDSQTGDFNGDGRADVVARNSAGEWWVWRSTGAGFITERWGAWSNSYIWENVMVADFTGDGRDDIISRPQNGNGEWWVAESTGSSFRSELWGSWDKQILRTDILTGDFNGDGKTDLTGRDLKSGWWWVSLSTGSSFQDSYWGRWSTFVEWKNVLVADINGDGRDDILGRTSSNLWFAAESTGEKLVTKLYSRWSPNEVWSDYGVADMNGDQVDDLFARASDGVWWFTASKAAFESNSPNENRQLGSSWGGNLEWLQLMIADSEDDKDAEVIALSALLLLR